MAEMTSAALVQLAKKHGGYSQPKLNDQLFLQSQGFVEIENLEPYTELKVLWLEQNAISVIEGLGAQEKLVSLFLQNNTIRRISGMERLTNLRILNLSHNFIAKIDALAQHCPLLESLQLAHNQLDSLSGCAELLAFRCLSSVDLSHNKIVRPEGSDDRVAVDFFCQMPALSVLYLQGNELIMGIKQYRRNMIVSIKTLTYLDERPVFDEERKATEAWAEGGAEAENSVRAAIRKEKLDHLTSCVTNLARMAEERRPIREQRVREWELKKEQERKLAAEERASVRRIIEGLEYDEDDARLLANCDESNAWIDLIDAFGRESLILEAEAQRAVERRAVESAAAAELEREERTSMSLQQEVEGATGDAKSAKREEMSYWLKQLEMTDDDLVRQMESEMGEMLRFMRPLQGYTKAADPSSSIEHRPPSAEKAAGAAPKFSKERVWAQYEAWENRQTKKSS